MELITTFISRHLQPFGLELWRSVVFWRIAALFFLFLSLAAPFIKETLTKVIRKKKVIEYDRDVFSRSCDVLNREQLDDLLHNLSSGLVHEESLNRLKEYLGFFSLLPNHFLFRSLRRRQHRSIHALTALTRFVDHHFIVHEPDKKKGKILCELPKETEPGKKKQWSPDKHQRVYEKNLKRLNVLIKKADAAYNAFLEPVNKRLFRRVEV